MGNKPSASGKGSTNHGKGKEKGKQFGSLKKALKLDGVDVKTQDKILKSHFDDVEVKHLYRVFTEKSAPSGRLTKEQFTDCLHVLSKQGLRAFEDTPFVHRLFAMLDTNGDGILDVGEFIGGMSLLCKGSPEEKLEQSFNAYDADGNGFISKVELSDMFAHAWMAGFRALMAEHSDIGHLSMDELTDFSEEMGTLFAENAFDTLDLNGDGELSFVEFKEFAMAEPKITASLNGFKKEVSITL